jgi:hypothetical protein
MRFNRSVISVLSLAVALAACAPRDEETAPPPPAPNVVTVRASDFTFEAPAEVPSGLTTFVMQNAGPNLHHMVIVRVDSGKTAEDVRAAFSMPGPPPAWLSFVGGPNAPDPGQESNATLDLTPGSYALLCLVDIPGGVPHIAQGMVKALNVTASTAPAAAVPTVDVKVSLFDYGFTLSKPLIAGPQTIEVVTNPNQQPHEIELFRLAPGRTADDFLAWVAKMDGPPPGAAIGGVLPAPAGVSQYFTTNLTPGDYLLVCFLPDAKDGKMHFEHGMIQTITIL